MQELGQRQPGRSRHELVLHRRLRPADHRASRTSTRRSRSTRASRPTSSASRVASSRASGPGRQTERYLAKVLNRITLPGALFLAAIALVPSLRVRRSGDIQPVPVRRHVDPHRRRRRARDDEADRQPADDAQLRGLPQLDAVRRDPGVRLVLLGQPGCRQGHAGARLSEHYGVAAHLHRRHVPRRGGGGHATRARGQGATWTRGELVPDEIVHRRRRGALRRTTSARATASCSTASRAPCRRPRSSSGCSRDHAARPRASTSTCPSEIVLDRIAGRRVCEDCERHLPRGRAAAARLDLRRVRRRRSCSATTTPRRPSRRGSTLYDQRDRADHRLLRASAACCVVGRRRRRRRRGLRAPRRGDRRARPRCRRADGDHRARRRDADRAHARAPVAVVAEMHEAASARRSARASPPLELDARRPRGARAPGRPLELPRLPRLPGGDLHVAERRDRARHPRRRTVLEEGDIVSIDCGAIIEGWHGDAAFTVAGRRRSTPRRSA